MNKFENRYKDTIIELKKLKAIKADDHVIQQIDHYLNLTNKEFPNLRFFRIALVSFLLVLLGSTTTLVAAQKTTEGSFLYPVKLFVDEVIKNSDQQSLQNNDEQNPDGSKTNNESQPAENLQENELNSESGIQNQNVSITPSPTTMPVNVLEEVAEIVPDPAKGVVEGVSETLQN